MGLMFQTVALFMTDREREFYRKIEQPISTNLGVRNMQFFREFYRKIEQPISTNLGVRNMQFFLTLLKIWQAVSPYVTAANYAAIIEMFNKAMVNFQGGDYRQLVIDLLEGLKGLIASEEAHIRMASAAGLNFAAPAGDAEWAEVQKVLAKE